ncbi:uncharacterized protein LOC119320290 [Triticum dicoccoides]|uniref:uncharacterized protein LOC119320290 n=1 Tax=Triticum dicoccoides TaxID=85692 RepID=UPI001891078B|nr:uncharacterized protein LOC119320290 [Triticum dicoccoides]
MPASASAAAAAAPAPSASRAPPRSTSASPTAGAAATTTPGATNSLARTTTSPAPCPASASSAADAPAVLGAMAPPAGAINAVVPALQQPLCSSGVCVSAAVAPEATLEQPWVKVGGRQCQRPRQELAPGPPRRMETASSLAFKRRTYGLCFRCLAPKHLVADSRGPVRCLACGLPGHRERGCPSRQPTGEGRRLRPRSPTASPCHSRDLPDCQAPRHFSSSSHGSPHTHRHTWASVVAPPAVANPSDSVVADLGLLEPLLAAQMEVLRSEMQALTVSRLEEVVRPLHDMMTALEGWTTLLRGFLERMEVVVGQLGYSPASPQSFEMHVAGSVGNVAGVEDFIESDVASCSSEVLASVAHLRDATPVLVSSLPMKEQAEAGGTVACVEAALCRLPTVPLMSPLLELQVGSADGREACMYGCFSPCAALCTSPLPVMPSDFGSVVVIEGVTPVLQCMPELQVLSVEPSSPISMVLSKVGSLGAVTVASTPSPPPLEPSQ